MSISDELMWRYIELLSFAPLADRPRAGRRRSREGRNPRDIKVGFAQEIVERFHGRAAAEAALADFEARFSGGGVPEDMPEVDARRRRRRVAIAQVLKQAELTASTSEALRMIEQGGVKLNGEKVSDKALKLAAGDAVVLQVGKRKFARVTIAKRTYGTPVSARHAVTLAACWRGGYAARAATLVSGACPRAPAAARRGRSRCGRTCSASGSSCRNPGDIPPRGRTRAPRSISVTISPLNGLFFSSAAFDASASFFCSSS